MQRIWTLEHVHDALSYLDPNCSRKDWVIIAMAIKAEFGDSGFTEWDTWSSSSDKYKEREARNVWKGLKESGRTSIGTLFHLATEMGFKYAPVSDEDKERLEIERQQRQEELRVLRAEQEQREHEFHALVATRSYELYHSKLLANTGRSQYLGEKRVRAYGVRFPRRSFLLVVRDNPMVVDFVSGKDKINDFFRSHDKESDDVWFLHIKPGSIVVPVLDRHFGIQNLQIIFPSGKKRFIKNGKKHGGVHWIGDLSDEATPVVICEGYATGASIYEATGWAVGVAFSADNLSVVAQRCRDIVGGDRQIIMAADDDRETDNNPGVTSATEAAACVSGCVVIPQFDQATAE